MVKTLFCCNGAMNYARLFGDPGALMAPLFGPAHEVEGEGTPYAYPGSVRQRNIII